MLKVALLGASGSLGVQVKQRLATRSDIELLIVSRSKEPLSSSIHWNFKSTPPDELLSVDAVVNCARSIHHLHNVRFNRILYKTLPPSVRFVNVSSNCIYARPQGALECKFFRGDGYIREKLIIEDMAKDRPNSILIRPSVVPDEGGWKKFLADARRADRVIFPTNSAACRIKIVSARTVAEKIETSLTTSISDHPQSELASDRPTLEGFLKKDICRQATTRTYYENPIKNLLVVLLNSRFLPDTLVLALQGEIIRRRHQSPAVSTALRPTLTIEGMTRLYLCGAHTR